MTSLKIEIGSLIVTILIVLLAMLLEKISHIDMWHSLIIYVVWSAIRTDMNLDTLLEKIKDKF